MDAERELNQLDRHDNTSTDTGLHVPAGSDEMSPKPLLSKNKDDKMLSETDLNAPTGSDIFSSKMLTSVDKILSEPGLNVPTGSDESSSGKLPNMDIDAASTTANKNKELNHSEEVSIPKPSQSTVNCNDRIDITSDIKPSIKLKVEPSLKSEGNGDDPMYSVITREQAAKLLNETSFKEECEWKNTPIKQIKSESPSPNEMSLTQTTSSFDEDDKTDQSECAIEQEIDFTVLDTSFI